MNEDSRQAGPDEPADDGVREETAAPETAAPETAAPETAAPETAAPETAAPETAAPETAAPETTAPETTAPETAPAADPPAVADGDDVGGDQAGSGAAGSAARRRRRNRIAAGLIGVLTLLLGFAFAVQVRSTDTDTKLAGAREEDLVRILDEANAREDRLRSQIAEQRAALDQLGSSDSRSATALQEARQRAEAIGILNGTIAAQGPGLRMTIRDPEGAVRVADLLDAIEELRGAGAETMQIDGVRVGVSTAVTGEPGALRLDGTALSAPYEVLVIGSPQDMQTAMNIPGGVVQRISGLGGSVVITQEQQVVVDALRPLDQPQYASPKSGD
jgi:uncharacterized protein YlxW (UPF0749 family)